MQVTKTVPTKSGQAASETLLRRAGHWEQTRRDVVAALTADDRAAAVSAHHIAKNKLSQAVKSAWACGGAQP